MSDDRDATDGFDELGDREYIVTEVVKTSRPKGIQSGDWYRYTIGHGSSPISGVRSGSLKSVRRYAEEFARNLNLRALQGYSAYAARRLQKK
ncbi:MAG: hypothetical protein JSU67_10560 [Gammaproteobacteria bacterium]|nr:MAG: hypothetical protein JSU67_10560 [Gammaproteobacteria bacterium]